MEHVNTITEQMTAKVLYLDKMSQMILHHMPMTMKYESLRMYE
jgi:hypothetical protein